MKKISIALGLAAALAVQDAPAGSPAVERVSSRPAAEKTVVIAGAGDISCAQGRDGRRTCRDRATSDLVVRSKPVSHVLTLGDNQYEYGSLWAFQTYYDRTWGRFKGKTHPATGNHDHGSGYYDYWGSRAGTRWKGYYAFNVGSWRLYAINSSIGVDGGSAQYRWLERDLARHPGKECVLAYWHHPRWSSGAHGNSRFMDPMWDLLFEYRADIVLSGHDHDYERFAPKGKSGLVNRDRGVRQFVVGTGGRSLYAWGETRKIGSKYRTRKRYGILKLWLSAGRYEWKFRAAARVTVDSGHGRCH